MSPREASLHKINTSPSPFKGNKSEPQPSAGKAKDVSTAGQVRDEVRKLIEFQRIVEQDENLGMPEVQAALEIVNHFNEDMVTIQSNMNSLLHMMDTMMGISESQQDAIWNLEGKTIA